jgi:hypothetical protein
VTAGPAPIVTPARGALSLVAALGALAACSSSEAMPPADGGEAGATAGLTCQQIRLCVLQGPCPDEACIQTCAARGAPEAEAAFEALRACTVKACPTVSDVNCACTEQCQANGSCLHESDVCLGAATVDDVCDSFCA